MVGQSVRFSSSEDHNAVPAAKSTSSFVRSLSDNHLTLRRANTNSFESNDSNRIFVALDDRSVYGSTQSPISSAPSRGRSSDKSSPTLVGDSFHGPPTSTSVASKDPQKRSRSPLKRMLGEPTTTLVKSTSMNDMAGTVQAPSQQHVWRGFLKRGIESVTKTFSHEAAHDPSKLRASASSRMPVSLDPPFQARLYSELELMICATANQYLTSQASQGRMTLESVQKVSSRWTAKGRPQVVEFMFDQSTQRDLVFLNMKSFQFYGPQADDILYLHATMQAWKALCREMSVRNFCMPDAVIKKHLRDIPKILDVLGAPPVTFLAFRDLQSKAVKAMAQQEVYAKIKKGLPAGQHKQWAPSGKAGNHRVASEEVSSFS